MDPWYCISQWIQNGNDDQPTPFASTHGKSLFEYAGNDIKFNCLFNKAMASDAQSVTNAVTEHRKGVFEGLKSLVDVEGNTGTVAKVIFNEFP